MTSECRLSLYLVDPICVFIKYKTWTIISHLLSWLTDQQHELYGAEETTRRSRGRGTEQRNPITGDGGKTQGHCEHIDTRDRSVSGEFCR